jgi:hypothetical protein
MGLDHPNGLIAVILAVVSFYGATYVVIALNVGWRFGYWLSSAALYALMFMMSIFWLQTGLGPRGKEATWVPIATSRAPMTQATFKEKPLQSVGSYPSSPWEPGSKANKLDAEPDQVGSAIQDCLTTEPEEITGPQKETCEQGQELLPSEDRIPVIDGSAVAVLPEVQNLRFTTDNGALVAMGKVAPLTRDPRVAKDLRKGQEMGPPFYVLLAKDKGSLRLPPLMSCLIFGLLLGVHLLGLNRAEKQKLSPVA